jgi:hypothetical protein
MMTDVEIVSPSLVAHTERPVLAYQASGFEPVGP